MSHVGHMSHMTPATAADAFLAETRSRVETLLNGFLAHKARTAATAPRKELVELLGEFLRGGKRLRPLLCMTGWHAATGEGDPTPVTRLAASLELFHAFALIHDDVMDASDVRRGRPTVHRTLAGRSPSTRGGDVAERFGTNAAILLGDLALTWSDELLHTTDLPEPRRGAVLECLDTMRTEVMTGQYLDLLTTGGSAPDIDTALSVARKKTASYTVERPLHLGALLADPPQSVLEACTAYGIPLGEAFQLRDDLLGVFAGPGRTGKPCLDDLRDGKNTVLLSLAFARATPAQADRLRALVGRPGLTEETAGEIRAILTTTGARAGVEDMINARHRQALSALETAPFPPAATQVLTQLADKAVLRAL
ncbi:polyprenyl synthetase family protein [Streptomyces sp. CA-250714]|uniref:polyprenyl synthetase family protein n=1 Tax=Streptomyces sp. CA-250714 TaxID=3240060 RepID=UPI003D938A51